MAKSAGHIVCPNCGQKYRWNPDKVGKNVNCVKCGTVFSMPAEPANLSAAPSKQAPSKTTPNPGTKSTTQSPVSPAAKPTAKSTGSKGGSVASQRRANKSRGSANESKSPLKSRPSLMDDEDMISQRDASTSSMDDMRSERSRRKGSGKSSKPVVSTTSFFDEDPELGKAFQAEGDKSGVKAKPESDASASGLSSDDGDSVNSSGSISSDQFTEESITAGIEEVKDKVGKAALIGETTTWVDHLRNYIIPGVILTLGIVTGIPALMMINNANYTEVHGNWADIQKNYDDQVASALENGLDQQSIDRFTKPPAEPSKKSFVSVIIGFIVFTVIAVVLCFVVYVVGVFVAGLTIDDDWLVLPYKLIATVLAPAGISIFAMMYLSTFGFAVGIVVYFFAYMYLFELEFFPRAYLTVMTWLMSALAFFTMYNFLLKYPEIQALGA